MESLKSYNFKFITKSSYASLVQESEIGKYVIILIILINNALCSSVSRTETQKNLQREEILEMAKQTREQVFQQYPKAKKAVEENCVGVAVFSNFGFKFMFMGSARGEGVLFSNSTHKPIYMRMRELQPGLGFGVQRFKIVFLFHSEAALQQFIESGWQFGGNLLATANYSKQGLDFRLGESTSSNVSMYQLSDSGAIVGISITGAKYFRDEELN
ncbi:lipid-binding SYLF domain-containing protein [Leptospira levettii]|nr:YSC84-related protein [Leptospira levettii]MCW7509772.1 YSC84-related protein [Leptospira levettii]